MKQDRLYRIEVTSTEAPSSYDDNRYDEEQSDPPGWREYAKAHPSIPDDADFFIPRRAYGIFKSRSAAKSNLGYFTRWGISAQIIECTPTWESIPSANARRAYERSMP